MINGGTAGLGRASVLSLAREGVELYVSARGEDRLVTVCAEISQETGVQITPIVADHSTDEGREKFLQHARPRISSFIPARHLSLLGTSTSSG